MHIRSTPGGAVPMSFLNAEASRGLTPWLTRGIGLPTPRFKERESRGTAGKPDEDADADEV